MGLDRHHRDRSQAKGSQADFPLRTLEFDPARAGRPRFARATPTPMFAKGPIAASSDAAVSVSGLGSLEHRFAYVRETTARRISVRPGGSPRACARRSSAAGRASSSSSRARSIGRGVRRSTRRPRRSGASARPRAPARAGRAPRSLVERRAARTVGSTRPRSGRAGGAHVGAQKARASAAAPERQRRARGRRTTTATTTRTIRTCDTARARRAAAALAPRRDARRVRQGVERASATGGDLAARRRVRGPARQGGDGEAGAGCGAR